MNDMVNRIANGQAQLLGIEDICTRLSISRTTFDRWVRNGGRKTWADVIASPNKNLELKKHIQEVCMDRVENKSEGSIKFPPPDIRIGNSPKWEMQTFKNWLTDNAQPGK
jgi:transposase-like protein